MKSGDLKLYSVSCLLIDRLQISGLFLSFTEELNMKFLFLVIYYCEQAVIVCVCVCVFACMCIIIYIFVFIKYKDMFGI